jgi:glycosyltransferase involved in cell wall biosynthesis
MGKRTVMSGPDVVWVLPDKLGGVYSFVQDMLRYCGSASLPHRAIRTACAGDVDSRPPDALGAANELRLEHALPVDNLYVVLRRLHDAIGHGPGVLVANDWMELAAVSWRETARTVISIVHGDFDYYYRLSVMHDAVIDAYVTYTRRVHERLSELLPHRRQHIHLLRYGVPTPAVPRVSAKGPLRLLYVGRLHRDKGVLWLPEIDRILAARGVDVRWTVHGDGPDRQELKSVWPDSATRVTWSGPAPIDAVRALYNHHDVFVLPSQFEALPVALLEAGAAGVVPVVSDLPSGIPEVVRPGDTGYRVAVGDVNGFASAIADLAVDRQRLETMSASVRALVGAEFEARACAGAYEQLFGQWRELRRPGSRPSVTPYGSRLDQPWMPNSPVRAIRGARRWLRGQ